MNSVVNNMPAYPFGAAPSTLGGYNPRGYVTSAPVGGMTQRPSFGIQDLLGLGLPPQAQLFPGASDPLPYCGYPSLQSAPGIHGGHVGLGECPELGGMAAAMYNPSWRTAGFLSPLAREEGSRVLEAQQASLEKQAMYTETGRL